MSLLTWLESRKGKTTLHKTYSFGASVVIIGALFKIQHYPGANAILPVGLGTEAVIFCLFALQKPHEDVDWSLVYPELAGLKDEESEDKGTVTEQLDNMLEEAKIGPELIESLEKGMRSLSETASKMSSIADASIATNDYVNNINSANKNLGELSENSSKAATSLSGMAGTDFGGVTREYIDNVKSVSDSMGDLNNSSTKASEILKELSMSNSSIYVKQIEKMSENVAALNALYEMQVEAGNENMRNTGQLYESISKMLENMNESIDTTRSYKTGMSHLVSQIDSLNTVYGNMLTAMNVRK